MTKNPSTGRAELKSYAHTFDSCQQDWYAVCSIIENTLEVVLKDHPQFTRVSLRSVEAGCYQNNFLLVAVRDDGKRPLQGTATRRRYGNQDVQIEDVYADEARRARKAWSTGEYSRPTKSQTSNVL